MPKNKEEIGRQASIDGFAHEHIVVGLLMKRYQNVSLVDLPLLTYDIIIVLSKDPSKPEDIIRAQVKTAKKSISFTGGTRGGVDREYKSNVKKYKQSTVTSDVIVGVYPNPENDSRFDLYFVPTIFVENLKQASMSIRKIECFKNNYDILENCKDKDYVLNFCRDKNLM